MNQTERDIRREKDIEALKKYNWKESIFEEYINRCNEDSDNVSDEFSKKAMSNILLNGEEQKNHRGTRSFVGVDKYTNRRVVIHINTLNRTPKVVWVGLADRKINKYNGCKMERGAL